MLKAELESLDGLPKEVAEHYKDIGGKYHLDTDSLIPKSKLDEFRSNNKKLFDEKRAIEERYKDVDPEDYQRTKKALAEVQSGTGDTFKQVVERHVGTVKEQYEGKVGKLSKELETASGEAKRYRDAFAETKFNDEFRKLAGAAKVKPGAVDDFLSRASQLFEFDLQSGKISARQRDGFPITEDSPESWAKGLADKAGHLFEESTGGGARGGSGKGPGGLPKIPRSALTSGTEEQRKIMATGKYVLVDG